MTDRRPLAVVAGKVNEMPHGDLLPADVLPVTMQQLASSLLITIVGTPIVTTSGDFITVTN